MNIPHFFLNTMVTVSVTTVNHDICLICGLKCLVTVSLWLDVSHVSVENVSAV